MNYEKPEVTLLGPAVNAVKGGKKPGIPVDWLPTFKTTTGAYEADE